MKKLFYSVAVLALSIICILSFAGCGGQGKPLPGNSDDLQKALEEGGYKVVFQDDFNGTEINRKVWRGLGEDGTVRRGAYYNNTKENIFVKDGNLTIRTFYKATGDQIGWHTSWLESRTLGREEDEGFSAKYGYFETRCIAPPTFGIWSAFWLMPDVEGATWDGSSTQFGTEIDIMESASFNSKNFDGKAQFVLHTDYSGAGKGKFASEQYRVSKMHSEFHTYGVMWTPTDYTWFIDGRKVLQTKHIYKNQDYGTSPVKQFPILSVEVVGNEVDGKPVEKVDWAGDPSKNDKSKNYDFIVDYVKVWQKD